jgi:hypothetical protein
VTLNPIKKSVISVVLDPIKKSVISVVLDPRQEKWKHAWCFNLNN